MKSNGEINAAAAEESNVGGGENGGINGGIIIEKYR